MHRMLLSAMLISSLLVPGLMAQTAPVTRPVVVLICRPVDVSPTKNFRDQWFAALSVELMRFRLAATRGVSTLPIETVIKSLPAYADFDREVLEDDYLDLARKSGCPFILSQKYEITDAGKNVQFYAEVLSATNGKLIQSIEKTFPVQSMGPQLDSSIIQIQKVVGAPVPKELMRFFGLSMFSRDARSCKEVGDAIIADTFGTGDKPSQAAEQFDAVLARDTRMELAYYLSGQAHSRAHHYNKAAEAYKNLYDIIPEYLPMYLGFVQALRQAKDFPSALAAVKQAETKDPGSIPLLVEKASIVEAMGRKAEAENTYQQILKINPQDGKALVFFARINNERARPGDAMKFADDALRIDRKNAGAWYEKGISLKQLQKYDDALQAFSQASTISPDDPNPWITIGDVSVLKKDYPGAVKAYTRAAALLPNEFEIQNKAAQANRMAGDIQKALAMLKNVEGRFSTNTVMQKELGLLELLAGDNVNARRHLESCLTKEQADARVPMGLGDLYTAQNQFDDAVRMYNLAMPNIADKNACRLALARAYLARSSAAQALPFLNEIIASTPNYRGVNRACGDARLMAGDRQQALASYLKERELYGDDKAVQQQIAMLYFMAGNWPQTEAEYIRFVKLDPNNALALYRLAAARLQLKNPAKAQAALAQASALGKPDQELLFLIGQGCALNGLYDKAIDSYKSCLALAPSREDAWLALSDAYLKTRNDTAAAEAYVKLFGLNGAKYKTNLADAGNLYFKLGKTVEARRCYTQFLDARCSDPRVNVNCAAIEYDLKNYSRVIELLKALAPEFASDEKTLMILAESYFTTGNYAAVSPLMSRVAARNPRNARAFELAALAGEKAGNLAEALRMYESFLALPATPKHRDYAFHAGDLCDKQGLIQQATNRFEQNVRAYPDDIRNYERLASLEFSAQDWTSVEPVLSKAVTFKDAKPVMLKMLAETYRALRRTDESVKWFQQYLVMVPADSTAWMELGSLLYNQKNYARAVAPLREAAKFMPKKYECAMMLGTACYEAGFYADAAKPLWAALAMKPAETSLLDILAKSYRTVKDSANLITVLQKWVALDAQSFDLRIELGGLLLAAKRTDEAVAVLQAASRIDQSSSKAYKLLARAFELKGDEGNRLANLTAVIFAVPKDADAHYELARFYLAKGQESKAEPYLKAAIQLSPAQSRARLDYGKLLVRAGKPADAFPFLEDAAKLEPDEPQTHAYLAYAASLTGKTQYALGEADIAIGKGAKDETILYLASQVYDRADQTVKAKQYLRDALTLDEKCVECYEALGASYSKEANYKQAVKSLMKAWELGGYRESVAFALARALSIDGKYPEATDFLNTVLTKNSHHDRALYELCHVLVNQEKPEEAENTLAAFEKSNEKTGWTHLARGEICEAQDKPDAAWISYNVAVRLIAGTPQIEDAFGRIYLQRRQFDEAIVHFGKALAADANNPSLLLDLAKAYEGQGTFDDAVQICTTVSQRFPDNAEVFYVIGRIRSKQNDHARAVEAINQGLAQNPNVAKLYNALGYEYAALQQYDQAIDAYSQALKLNPVRYLELYRRIGDLYYQQVKDEKKAKDFYQKYVKAGGDNPETKALLEKL